MINDDAEEGSVKEGRSLRPAPDNVLVLGADFEVKWWAERVEEVELYAKDRVAEIETEAQRLLAEKEGREAELHAELTKAQRLLAEKEGREAELHARLGETSSALLDANQALAQLPVLRQRTLEAQAESASAQDLISKAQAESASAQDLISLYRDSHSWRLTRPLRRVGRLLRRHG